VKQNPDDETKTCGAVELQDDFYTLALQVFLHLSYRKSAEVKDGCGEEDIGTSLRDTFIEMLQCACSS
jgi:hypothetical protein